MRSVRRDVRTLAITLVFALGWLFVWLYGSGSLPWLQSWYDVRAATLSAGSLGVGASVTIAGIKVGRVTSITQQGTGAVLGLEIQQKYGPIPRDSRFGVRLRTIVGENYVALYPGHSRQMLPNNGLLGPTQSVENVDVDQILSLLRGGTRRQAQKMIEGLGGALGGRGPELNSLLQGTAGVIDASAPITQVLAQNHVQVSRLAAQLGDVSAAIGQRQTDIAQIAQGARTTFASIANRDAYLAQTLQRLPGALAQVRATTGTLRSITGTAAPVLGNLAVAVNDLDPALHTLLPAAREGNAVLHELGVTAPPLVTTLARLRRIAAPAAGALPQLRGVLCQAQPAVRYLAPYAQEFGTLLEDMGSATNFYDANAHAARLYVTVGADSLKYFSGQIGSAVQQLTNLGVLGLHDSLGYNPFPAPGNAGETNGPGIANSYSQVTQRYPRITAAC